VWRRTISTSSSELRTNERQPYRSRLTRRPAECRDPPLGGRQAAILLPPLPASPPRIRPTGPC
jgi:hypothetical protein